MAKVIQLTGYPRCGKDTFATTAIKLYPELKILRLAYADYLKEEHAKELGITDLDTYNRLLHTTGVYNGNNLRDGLSRLGIKLKKQNINVFVDVVKEAIETTDADLVIITDMRYLEEYAYAKLQQHTMLRIYAHGIPEAEKTQPWNALTQVFKVHDTIYNDSTLTQYEAKVEVCLDLIMYNSTS